MSGDDGNGQPAARRYVIVDHDGESVELPRRQSVAGGESELAFAMIDRLEALPVGGRFTVTRVS